MGRLQPFCAGASVDDLPGKHIDAILLNVVEHAANTRKLEKTSQLLQCSEAKDRLLDSSGFSLLKAGEADKEITCNSSEPVRNSVKLFNLAPRHIIKAATEISPQPQEMVALDWPIRDLKVPCEREKEFQRKFEYNVDWAKETAQLRQEHCPEIGLLVPIQCYSLKHLDIFMKSISDIDFQGLSMPTRYLEAKEIGLFLTRFWQMGIRRVHILGTSAFFTIALAAYMAQHFFDFVSLDATSWKKFAIHNTYISPHGFSATILNSHTVIDERIQMDCRCPWCRDRSFTYIKHLPYSDRRIFLGCHNYWTVENVARELYANAGTLNQLEKYLKMQSRETKKIEKLMDGLFLIEALKDEDIKYLEKFLI